VSAYGRFLETVRREGLIPRGSRVLAAVSGGADSVCLLDLLLTARKTLGIEVKAAHVNHGLRAAAADDERFVRALCRRLVVRLVVRRVDVRRFAREHRLSIEEAGRETRFAALRSIARRESCQVVALGHNAEDNLETILLNVARGSGLSGVAGIPVRRGVFVRPLLDIERDSLRRHLRSRGLEWVEDESNADPSFRRNLLRQRVLPALLEVNAAAPANARRLSRILAADDHLLDRLAAEALAAALDAPGGRRVDIEKLARYDESLQRRALRLLIPALDLAAVDRVLELMRGRPGRVVDLDGGNRARRSGGFLVFELTEDSRD
jgi:tRNA(Ile)-lysidine synthase